MATDAPGSLDWWSRIWRNLRRIAAFAFDHYVAVAGTVAAIAGAFYGLAYARFYDAMNITPEQAGLTPAQILAHSVIGGVALMVVGAAVFFCLVLPLIPLREKQAIRGAGSWPQFLANAVLTGVGVLVLVGFQFLAEERTFLAVLIPSFPLFFLLGGSLDLRRINGRLALRPSPLELVLERYVVVLIACLIPALAFTGLVTFVEAKRLGEEAAVGKVVKDPTIGIFPFLGVRADPALISWRTSRVVPRLPHCALYLGSSNGDRVFYDHRSSSTFRIPEDDVAIELQTEATSCEAPIASVPPAVTETRPETFICRHGAWKSQAKPSFEYHWIWEGHPIPDQGGADPWLLDAEGIPPESVIYCRVTASTPLGQSSALSRPLIVSEAASGWN